MLNEPTFMYLPPFIAPVSEPDVVTAGAEWEIGLIIADGLPPLIFGVMMDREGSAEAFTFLQNKPHGPDCPCWTKHTVESREADFSNIPEEDIQNMVRRGVYEWFDELKETHMRSARAHLKGHQSAPNSGSSFYQA